jgi:(2Fe-2S) ferredoxin
MRADIQVSDFSRIERAFGWLHGMLIVKGDLWFAGVSSFRLGFLILSLRAGRHGRSPVVVGWRIREVTTACKRACSMDAFRAAREPSLWYTRVALPAVCERVAEVRSGQPHSGVISFASARSGSAGWKECAARDLSSLR